MRSIYFIGLAIFIAMSTFSCRERIDAGHVGIRVNLYGTEKGVDDVTEITGSVWYNPFTTEIHEIPTYVMDVSYAGEDRLKLTTNDGLEVTIEVGLNYRVETSEVTSIFRTYRKPLPALEQGIIRKAVRTAFSEAIADFSAEGSYSRKTELLKKANQMLVDDLMKRGFFVENLTYISDPQPPSSVKANIEAKINAKQMALRKEEELRQAEADAKKRIAESRGMAEAKIISAEADAKANKIISSSITPMLIRYQTVEKWDGKLPQVSGADDTIISIK